MEVDQRSHDLRNMTYRERLLHLRTQNIVSAEHDFKEDTEIKLPRIVLKDSLGNRLDTYTVLQEALYRAEWNVKRRKEAKLPEEWRLPRAPLPARPDYSRATPSTFRSRYPQQLQETDDINIRSEQSSNGKRLHEIDIDDVSFVKQSLNHLPQVPSLAFLHQEFLRDRKDYLQIVGSVLLHKRFLSETDKRESIYNFPGFCTGCQRSGLCYGCERSSEPHYHVDGLKLGEAYQLNGNGHSGFLGEDKFADNWRIKFPELTRRNRGKDGSKLSHDSQFLGNERLLLGEDPRGGRKEFAIISNEKLPDLPGLGPFKYENDDQGSSEKDPDRMDIYNQQDLLSDLDKLSRHGTHSDEGRQGEPGHSGQRKQGEGGSQGQNGERTGEKLLRVDMAGEDSDRDNDGAILADRGERGSENDMSTSASTGQSTDHEKDSNLQREKSDKSSGHYSQHTSRWTSGTEGYEEDDDEEDDMQEDSATTSSAQKRRRLYRAPPPFKLKQRKQRATQSRSPFSTDRKYDVPTGKAWLPKKSNKRLTEFVEFEHKEVDWKEPKKFTIKHSDKSTTRFWSPPPSKDSKKKKTTRRRVQGPPPSPDSGLESEKVQDDEDEYKSNGVSDRPYPRREIKIHIPKVDMSRRNSEIVTDAIQGKQEDNKTMEDFFPIHTASRASSGGTDSVPAASVENVSLTSEEPDLELSFNDVLDIEKLPEHSSLDERQVKRKLRRHKKLANREIQISKEDDVKEKDGMNVKAKSESDLRKFGERELETDYMRKEEKSKETMASISRDVHLQSCEKENKFDKDENDFGESIHSNTITYEEGVMKLPEEARTFESQCQRSTDMTLTSQSSKERKKSRSVSRKKLKSNSSRVENTNVKMRKIKNHGEKLKGSNVKVQPDDEKEKLMKEVPEYDFSDLPSIQSTLKKIVCVDPKYGKIREDSSEQGENVVKNLTDSNAEVDRNDVALVAEIQNVPVINIQFYDEDRKVANGTKNINFQRPRSASTESCYEKPNVVRLKRTSSLPNIAIKVEQTGDKKNEPVCTAVFLPKFPARFRPKKTKMLNPKRVPGRQRPISQEQTTDDNPDEAPNQNLESENSVMKDKDSPSQKMLVDGTDDENDVKNEEKEVVLDAPRPSPSTPMNEHGFENEEVEEIIDSIKEIPLKTSDSTDLERTSSPLSQRGGSPALKHGDLPSKRPVGISPIVEKPQKKEKVKKQKKEVKKPPTPIRSCSPHTPIPLDEEPVVALDTQETDVVPPVLPELPPIELPPLPEYAEEKEKKEKKKVPHRVSIEPMPKLQEAPPPSKKSKPVQVPRSKPIQKRKSLVPAEAPVTVDEISHMKDPLDFLAKYCIISLDRLPYYEKVYNKVVVSQPQRYDPPLSPISGLPLKPTKRKERQKEKGEVTLHDMVSVTKGMEPFKVGLNVPEQYLEKLIYTIQICDEKHLDISERLRELEIQKVELLAEKAKQLNPDIAKVEFKLKKTKKKKKKKKSGAVEVEEPVVFSKKDITDEVIVARIDEKMMKKLMKEPDLHHIQCDMERCADRLATLEFRILQMENEKNILDMYCTDVFFTEQLANERPVEFRRQQSNLYNKLHPDPDIEMNIEELESALHTINSTLLTENEFGYLFHVLNLAGRRKINFKLFSVIAALSEKISQMDPVIKDLLNKDDYNALDIKMERSKELFGLLDDGDTAMYGNALASNLAVELTAGGLTPEHTSYVMSKFNREGKGFIDFLDYVMYVPLFIEIHERIVQDPLNAKLVI